MPKNAEPSYKPKSEEDREREAEERLLEVVEEQAKAPSKEEGKGEGKGYKRIQKYDAAKAEYARICADPYDRRTDLVLARQLGVSNHTLTRWKKDDDFKALVLDYLDEVMRSHAPEITKALMNKAKRGDIGALRLYYQQAGILKPEKLDIRKAQVVYNVDVPASPLEPKLEP